MLKRGWWIVIAFAVLAEASPRTSEAQDAPVAVFVKPDDGAPRRIARSAVEATGGIEETSAVPSTNGIRRAAVAVSVDRLVGWRATEGTLGIWHAEGALQEGGVPREETLPDFGDERRASEMRLRGASVLGRGRVLASTASRNYDPASGALLADRTGLVGRGAVIEGSSRIELGYDLARKLRVRGSRMLGLDVAASRERKDAPVAWQGVLSPMTPTLTSLLTDADVPAVALLGADEPESPDAIPLPGVAAARTRIDSLRMNARLLPQPGPDPRARARLTIGLQRRRQFDAVCCRLGGAPRAIAGRSDTSHFVAAAWNRGRLGFTYRFSLLVPEDLPGPQPAIAPRMLEHQLYGTTNLGETVRLRLTLARVETSNERFARDLAATRSVLGLDWTFRPRWTASADFRALDSTGPGNSAGLRLWSLDGRLTRSIVLPRAVEGELFARGWFQNEPGRFQHAPGRVVSRATQDPWALEAGFRVPF